MNSPPSVPPPLPIRPQRSASSNCLLGLLGGCGALVLVLIIGALIAMPRIKRSLSSIAKVGSATPTCVQKLQGLGSALDQYSSKHKGAYPDKLTQLVPNYLPDASALQYVEKPGAPVQTVTYYKPPANAAPQFVVARFLTGHFDINIGPAKQSQTLYIVLMKDGELYQQTMSLQPISGR